MSTRRSKKLFSRTWIIILSILVVLIIIRLILPGVLLHYANKSLAGLQGYYGHIDDIDLSIYRGAYQVDNIYINKVDSTTGDQTPFIKTDKIDLSVEWSALFDGRVVGELIFINPVLIFTKDKADPEDVQKDTTNFKKVLKDLMPLKINRFEIRNGQIHYKDESTKPVVDLMIDRFNVIATNLSTC